MDFQPKTPARLSPGHLHSCTCWLRLLKCQVPSQFNFSRPKDSSSSMTSD